MTLPQEEKPPSAFYPADNAAVIAHLNYLQAIITRLAGNSAQCKTWCLAIVSALFSFAGAFKNDKIVAIRDHPDRHLSALGRRGLSRPRKILSPALQFRGYQDRRGDLCPRRLLRSNAACRHRTLFPGASLLVDLADLSRPDRRLRPGPDVRSVDVTAATSELGCRHEISSSRSHKVRRQFSR